jgi:tellurite resistance protein TehA-like permease
MSRYVSAIAQHVPRVRPEAGGAVMATGIVSVALRSDGYVVLSDVLLVIALLVWLALGCVFAWRLLAERERWWLEARSPGALTAVAASAVLGTRLTQLGWSWAAWPLLALACSLCLVVVGRVLASLPRRTGGGAFLVVVAPQSLAVLAAELARTRHLEWLALVALAPLASGLCLYPAILGRYDLRGLGAECGEHWIAGGSLAISALASGELTHAAAAIDGLHALVEPLKVLTLVLWALTIAWLPALVAGELRRPRLRYSISRWATIFPLGMYAQMSFTAATVAGSDSIEDFARVWTWVALIGWCAVTRGAVRGSLNSSRRSSTADHSSAAR